MRTTILFTALFLSVFSVSAEEFEVSLFCTQQISRDGSTWYRYSSGISSRIWSYQNSSDGKFQFELFDGRNCFSRHSAQAHGFAYFSVGRPPAP